MAIIRKHIRLVDEAIKSMGIDPLVCKDENSPHVWKLHRDKAQIIIVLQESEVVPKKKVPTICIMSPITHISKDKIATDLLLSILEINHKLTTATFSLSNNWLILSSTYMADAMQPKDVAYLLNHLSYHAVQFKEEFKG